MSGTTMFQRDEAAFAEAMARELERLAGASNLMPTEDFADRIMAAVAAEPSPQPIADLGSAVRSVRLGAALAAIRDAWRVAFGSSRPFVLRAQALALVLVVGVLSVGVGSAAVVGASKLFTPPAPPQPSQIAPTPSTPPSPSPSPTPSVSPSPSPSSTVPPGATPSPIDTAQPTETAEPTDSGGGNSGPGGGGSGNGSGSGSGNSGPGSGSSGPGSDDTSLDDSGR
jgi:uncharacterized membrane protein YgcG